MNLFLSSCRLVQCAFGLTTAVGPDPHIFSSIALCVVRGVTDRKPIERCVLHYACLLDGFVHPSSLLFEFLFTILGLFFNAFVAFLCLYLFFLFIIIRIFFYSSWIHAHLMLTDISYV